MEWKAYRCLCGCGTHIIVMNVVDIVHCVAHKLMSRLCAHNLNYVQERKINVGLVVTYTFTSQRNINAINQIHWCRFRF